MYNSTTRSYTMEDASGSFDWMVENMDPADCQSMTDAEIYAWVDREIATAKEQCGYELDEQIEGMTFPRMGYTTTQKFENAEEYEAFKRAEIESDLNGERESVFSFLKNWVAG
jgi:hypothetical protein